MGRLIKHILGNFLADSVRVTAEGSQTYSRLYIAASQGSSTWNREVPIKKRSRMDTTSIHGPDIEGMQVEVDPGVGKHTGGLYESGGRGWVLMPTPEGERALKPGEWNDLGVSVRGNDIVIYLNSSQVTDYIDTSPKFTDGVIGLQIHAGGGVKMRWKDLYIKER